MRIVIEIDGLDAPGTVRAGVHAPTRDAASAPGAGAADDARTHDGGAASPPSAPSTSQSTSTGREPAPRPGGARPGDAAGARDGGAAPTLGAFGGGIGPTTASPDEGARERGSGAAPQAGVGSATVQHVDRSGGPAPAELVGLATEGEAQPADESSSPPDDLSGGAFGGAGGADDDTNR